jgi:transposase InsO family protein
LFARTSIHITAKNTVKGGFIRDLFEETFKNHGLLDKTNPINILSDGGSENKGALLDWINQIEAPPVVKKLTARTEGFPYSNSMAESTHSIYKSEFLQGKHSIDKEDHLKNITLFFNYYNNNRFPFEFYGLTPMEVLKGEKPDKTKYREQIKNAQKERLEENRKFNCCPLVCS